MKFKRVMSLGLVAVGFLMICYGAYSKYSISQMKSEVHQISQSKNQTIKSVGKDLEAKIMHIDAGTKGFFFVGGILIVFGCLAGYYWRDKKRR